MNTFKNVMMRIGAVIAAEALGVIGAGSLVGIEDCVAVRVCPLCHLFSPV